MDHPSHLKPGRMFHEDQVRNRYGQMPEYNGHPIVASRKTSGVNLDMNIYTLIPGGRSVLLDSGYRTVA